MARVYTASNPTEAYLVKGLLEAAGIAARIQGEYAFGGRGELPATVDTMPSVWVDDAGALERALSLVAEYDRGGAAARYRGQRWQCGCGEVHEGQFTACWRCGAFRPE